MRTNYKKLSGFVFGLFSGLISLGQIATHTLNYTGNIQTFTVPNGVTTVTIDARGAQGGGLGGGGGLGARMMGTFSVTPGQVLSVVVPSMGLLQVGGNAQNSSGGGGGAFVYLAGGSPTLLVAAGGGGGRCNYTPSVGLTALNNGTTGANGNAGGGAAGGVGGLGGGASSYGGGGTGWLGNGNGPSGSGGLGYPTFAGGAGLCCFGGGGNGGNGGFGGGGGGGNAYGGGGGGGGYSGGGAGTDPNHGGGGGSFSVGQNQNNTSGFQTGNGQVLISYTVIPCSAVPVLTLTGGSPATNMMVAYNPQFGLYYASGGGGGCNMLHTFTTTGGSTINATNICYDSRGLWWNTNLNRLEGNGYNGAGIYTITLNGSGIPTGAGAYSPAGNTQPDPQSMGSYDPTNNSVVYYNNGIIWRYNRTTGVFQNSVNVTGLPTGLGNITTYGGFYIGTPGFEYALYNYNLRVAYVVNINTGAYVTTIQFPNNAPQPSNYGLSYSNGLFFLATAWSSGNWIGYKIKIDATASPSMICNGQSATLTATGGNTYTWSTGANTASTVVSPSVTSSYTVTSNLGVCPTPTADAVISVTVNPSPTLAVSGNTLICGTGTNVLTVSGANTYSWNTGATSASVSLSPTVTTNYTVIGTNTVGNCTSSKTVDLVVSSIPSVAVTAPSMICVGESATLSANGANSYSWNTGAATSSVVVSPTTTTNYTVVGTNTAGCSGTGTISLIVSPCTGVAENSEFQTMKTYPNPSQGEFTIELNNGKAKTISITDISGREVKSITSDSEKIQVNISDLSNGMYLIKINSGGQIQTLQVIKQ